MSGARLPGGARPAAIEVVGVAKRFRKHSEPAKTLKERLLTIRRSTVDEFYALDGIDFEVGVGETFGILGHNGSGKSTMLKCIAGTLRPSRGTVRVRGRLSALLELGAGFHPDLTGRENVYLNGSILGFSRARIDAIFDEIVAFSGLEEFIDTQVKHYSSGMFARLGFAVAVNVEPDVLLVDEVLAVGDEAFQRKCIERIRGFQADGRTICLVTHSPDQVRYLCDRALVLDHGKLLHVGAVDEAVSVYRQSLAAQSGAGSADDGSAGGDAGSGTGSGSGSDSGVGDPVDTVDLIAATSDHPARIVRSWVEPPADGSDIHRPGDQVVLGLRLAVSAPGGSESGSGPDEARPVRVRILIHAHDGVELLNASTLDIAGADLEVVGGEHDVRFVIDDIPYLDGQYLVTFVVTDPAEREEYDRQEQVLVFGIRSGRPVYGRVALALRVESESSPRPPSPAGGAGAEAGAGAEIGASVAAEAVGETQAKAEARAVTGGA